MTHAWFMVHTSLLLLVALALLASPAWADEADEPAPIASPGEAKESTPIELDLSWNPALSDETVFTNEESDATKPATLRILCTTDGATVKIDGEPYGEAPRVVQDIAPGVHTVEVQLPTGPSFTRQIFLLGGRMEELTVHPGGTANSEAAFVLRTISTILATLVAIPAGATQSARLARETEMPGLITNFDVVEPVPRD